MTEREKVDMTGNKDRRYRVKNKQNATDRQHSSVSDAEVAFCLFWVEAVLYLGDYIAHFYFKCEAYSVQSL